MSIKIVIAILHIIGAIASIIISKKKGILEEARLYGDGITPFQIVVGLLLVWEIYAFIIGMDILEYKVNHIDWESKED